MVCAGTHHQDNARSYTACSWAGRLASPGMTLEPCEELQDSSIVWTVPVNSSQQTNKQLLGLWMAVSTWTRDIGFGRPPLWLKKVKTNWLGELHCMLFTLLSGSWPTHRQWPVARPYGQAEGQWKIGLLKGCPSGARPYGNHYGNLKGAFK